MHGITTRVITVIQLCVYVYNLIVVTNMSLSLDFFNPFAGYMARPPSKAYFWVPNVMMDIVVVIFIIGMCECN